MTHSDIFFFKFMKCSSSQKNKGQIHGTEKLIKRTQLVKRSVVVVWRHQWLQFRTFCQLLNKKACVHLCLFNAPIGNQSTVCRRDVEWKLFTSKTAWKVQWRGKTRCVNNSMAVNKKCSAKWKLDQAIESIFHAYIHFIINFLLVYVCVCVCARAPARKLSLNQSKSETTWSTDPGQHSFIRVACTYTDLSQNCWCLPIDVQVKAHSLYALNWK